MRQKSVLWATLCLLTLTAVSGPAQKRPRPSTVLSPNDGSPEYWYSAHDVGRLYLGVSNDGSFGPGEFPRGSYKQYLYRGGIWVGAVVDGDTLVSQGAGTYYSNDFHPAAEPNGRIIYRSTIDPSRPWYEGAVSHQDYIATFTDTCMDCASRRSNHTPLNVEVTRSSYSWAYDYAQDFVLMDYAVKNIGERRLREIYIGIYIDGDVHTTMPLSGEPGGSDDVVGYLEHFPALYMGEHCPIDSDQLNIGWTADADGNRWRPQEYAHVYDISGVTIIRAPRDSLSISFNWWSSSWRDNYLDFGPQARASYRPHEDGNYGTPWTDEAQYHYLRNNERDYDQAWQATRPSWDPIWVQPPAEWRDSLLMGWTDSSTLGIDPRFLLSFGPFALEPGQSLPFTMAYVAGTHFQRDVNIARFLPYHPAAWYEKVRFDQLALNTMWAKWIYDNPGVDTDSDGYAGTFNLCQRMGDSAWVCDTTVDYSADPDTTIISCRWDRNIAWDTVWRTGDGVPDFKAAYPPPNPSTYKFVNRFGDTCRGLRVFPGVGRVRVVWNGLVSETSIDRFSHRRDFEGYRVYVAYDDRPSSFSVVASYDLENYARWEWNRDVHRFIQPSAPFTLQELRCLYADGCGDTTWHPRFYTRDNPLFVPADHKYPERVYFFEPVGYNRSILANDPINANTKIKRVYPNAPIPPLLHPDSISLYYPDRNDTTYFTEDGYLKYFEYEYTFEDILPTVSYFVNVTAFDQGYPELGLGGLESDPAFLPKAVYPLPSSKVIAERGLDVFVYPNPYRLDADYRDRDYEARLRWHVPEDKTRLIHFANLPPKCTISIFSLDGDLIRQLKHDVDPVDYLANHETWNLINRNLQLVVSGLYYWVVEDEDGNSQIGKLVIIM